MLRNRQRNTPKNNWIILRVKKNRRPDFSTDQRKTLDFRYQLLPQMTIHDDWVVQRV